MTAPSYIGVQQADIPAITPAPGVTVHLVAGELEGRQGPIDSLTETFMSVVRLEPDADVTLPTPAGRTVFLYVVRGDVKVDGSLVPQWHLAELGDGDEVRLSAKERVVLLFGHSAPLGEPVVAHGPFVMNTREEIAQAVQDYQNGLFGDPAALA